jgi:hypothetical protein
MGARALLVAAALIASPPHWKPHTREAAAYAQHRSGIIAFAVRTPDHLWGRHVRQTYPSASVLKAMLLVTYLNRRDVRNRPLRAEERRRLGPMIRRSDNGDATATLAIVGPGGLRHLARRAGMHRFTPVTGLWGLSRIDAEDQTRFFLHIDQLMPPRHRAYGMSLLRGIVHRQRWGIARVRPPGWHLYFKGGWGSATGWVNHQVALLVRGNERVSIAILTRSSPSHEYGKRTLRGLAKRLLRRMPS